MGFLLGWPHSGQATKVQHPSTERMPAPSRKTALVLNDDTIVTATDLAKLIHLSHQRIRILVDEGVLERGPMDTFRAIDTCQAYVKYLRNQSRRNSGKDRMTNAKAQMAELDLQAREGTLVPMEEVERLLADMVLRFRSRIRAIPSRLAPMCAPETDVRKIHELCETFHDEALEELAITPIEIVEQTRTNGSAGSSEGEASSEDDDI